MKFTKLNVQDEKPCKKILEIEVPKEEVSSEINNTVDTLQKVAVVPGFRVGKVPREVLIKEFKNRIEDDSLQKLINNACKEACGEKKIVPISQISISEVKFNTDSDLYFKASFEVMSDIKIKKYKGINIIKQKIKVTDEDVDKVISYLREREATYVPIENSEVKTGDLAVVDFEGYLDGKALEKFKGDDFSFEVGRNMVFESFEKTVIGMKPSERKEEKITIPQDYYDENLRDKQINVKIHLKSIKEKKLPELDNEFAKGVSECSTIDELREKIKNEIFQDREQENINTAKSEIIKKLSEENLFDVPDSMVNSEYDSMMEDLKNRMQTNNLDYAKIGTTEEKIKEDYKKVAAERVKGTLIIEKIADLENIKPTEQEIKARCDEIVKRYKDEKIKEYYGSEKGFHQVAYNLTIQKTLDFLYANAKITEK